MYRREKSDISKYIGLILMDELCLVVSLLLAYMVRHGLHNPFRAEPYVNIMELLGLINLVLIGFGGLFDDVLHRGYYKELVKTVSHVILVVLIGAFCMFSMKQAEAYSRIVIYLFGCFYSFLSYISRILWKVFISHAQFNPNASSLFIITTRGHAEETIAAFTDQENRLNYRILGICITDSSCIGEKICGVTVNTDIGSYTEFLCREWCDEVYVNLNRALPKTQEIVDKLLEMGIVVHFEIENFQNQEYPHQIVEKVGSHNVITMSMNMATSQQLMLKRLIDILAGLVGCFITLILTVILGPIIYIQSPGPIFFKQIRIGKNGKKFRMYKFRSMYMDADARKAELMKQNRVSDGMMFKLDHDPRIIGCKQRPDGTWKKGIGNFIRDWSLDEFPQFFNVLIGNMSLCGTRPPTEDEWNKYQLHHRARLAIKPGITGMWQTSGRSNITDFEEVVELDKEYIKKWSLGLDLRIILKTFLVIFKKDGAM